MVDGMTDRTQACPVAHTRGATVEPPPRPLASRLMPPGPSRAELLSLVAQGPHPCRVLERCAERYGDIFRLPVGRGLTFVNSPDHIAQFATKPQRYRQGDLLQAAEPAVGRGLILLEGDQWRSRRRALNPMFNRPALHEISPIVARSIELSMERWERLADTGDAVDLKGELELLTMKVFAATMLPSLDDDDVSRLVELFHKVVKYVAGLQLAAGLPSWLPVPWGRGGVPAAAEIRSLLERVIKERRASPTDEPDALNQLLAARYEDGQPLSDEEVRDDLFVFMIAGFDTTAVALTWALALLATNPHIAERLRTEADSYAGAFESLDAVNEMPYAEAVFFEAQRIQGTTPLVPYSSVEDDEIAGFHIPAGSEVAYSPYLLGRDSRLWPSPDRFDPDRFLGERYRALHHYQFLPFGAGSRKCIGFRMSTLEAQFALTMIMRRFHFQPTPGFKIEHQWSFMLGVKGGLPVTLHRRLAA
jgi:enediyne biosynthesis protein E7